MRQRLLSLVQHPWFLNLTIGVILLNAVTLGLETSDSMMAAYGPSLRAIDFFCLIFFVGELSLKLTAHGWRFFKDGWNIFDTAVVAIALVPAQEGLAVLRTLRILRVLRLISLVPQMRKVIGALFHALPGMGSIVAILLLLFYVSAVVATKLFGDAMPEEFGTLGHSFYSLFQIMTLEGWAEMAKAAQAVYPLAWLFFVPFILIITFAVLNLFIAIIVDSMQQLHKEEEAREMVESLKVRSELEALRNEVAALSALLRKP